MELPMLKFVATSVLACCGFVCSLSPGRKCHATVCCDCQWSDWSGSDLHRELILCRADEGDVSRYRPALPAVHQHRARLAEPRERSQVRLRRLEHEERQGR